jgi:aspartyl-tRNA(Asn)/glutamyl-tRNA(Gln) amidotransferase subunit A
MQLHCSILEASQLIRKRAISPVELTRDCLGRIAKFNPLLNAFITVTAESALEQAHLAEEELRQGQDRGPLHGIPIALKDLIDTAGVLTTSASGVFQNRIPQHDADVVVRMKQAGAIVLGKQNLHEFAYGGSSLVSHYGDVHNAWNPAHIAGGSSGGSATSVAAGMGFAAIGTDTAGSIREPAALCGVVGLKPTYGVVSARGVFPLSPSLDHVGPIARTVSDVAVLFRVIASTMADSSFNEAFDLTAPDLQKGFRIGVPRSFFFDDIDPEVSRTFEQALSVLTVMGGEIRDVELQVPTDRVLQMSESYASHQQLVRRSPELYQPETLRRILSGEQISMEEVALHHLELTRVRQEIPQLFDEVDVLVTPATPIPAPLISGLKANPEQLRPAEILLLRNTRPFNVWGLPAISVPCGFTKAGLPLGLQIAGPHGAESVVLRLAYLYEQATEWHKLKPALYEADLQLSNARQSIERTSSGRVMTKMHSLVSSEHETTPRRRILVATSSGNFNSNFDPRRVSA